MKTDARSVELLINRHLHIYRDGLLLDTVPFWERHSPDQVHGGLFTFLDHDGTLISTDKPMWLNGRGAWLFARLYNQVEPREQWLQLSRQVIEFVSQHGFDHDGRMFFLVTRDGRPLRKRRYLFTETFATIALAEYARASGCQEYLDRARELFRLILRYHRTPGLLPPKVEPKTRPMQALAMPMILIATAQVMRSVDDDSLYDEVINAAIQTVTRDFARPELRALLETVGEDGSFLNLPEGREVNPGHAIETAGFILDEAERRNDRDLIELACRIIDWSLDLGWDEQFGGIYCFRDCKRLPVPRLEHDMKLWWPHNEAIYSTLLAYHLTGRSHWLDWYQKLHDWTYRHFPDPQHGEWFGYLHRDGTIASTLKGNLWKGPFHLPRMQLKCWQLLERMAASPVADAQN